MRTVFTPRTITLTALLPVLAFGCAEVQPTGTSIIVDPGSTQREAGATDDVLQVCQEMLGSMRRDQDVYERPAPRLIILEPDGILVDPKLRDYNARMLYNQFTANLNKAAGTEFRFLDRQAVSRERQRQLSGEVKTGGVDRAAAGADMVLKIELIALQGAGTKTVQYNFKLTNLDGIDLWTDAKNIIKRS